MAEQLGSGTGGTPCRSDDAAWTFYFKCKRECSASNVLFISVQWANNRIIAVCLHTVSQYVRLSSEVGSHPTRENRYLHSHEHHHISYVAIVTCFFFFFIQRTEGRKENINILKLRTNVMITQLPRASTFQWRKVTVNDKSILKCKSNLYTPSTRCFYYKIAYVYTTHRTVLDVKRL